MHSRAAIKTKTIHVGVTELARETGLSQPYVSKLLARGFRPDEVREQATRARHKRDIRAVRKAEREQYERRMMNLRARSS